MDEDSPLIKAAVVTISDKGYRKERHDTSGPLLASLLRASIGAEVVAQTTLPDEQALIERELIRLADDLRVDLILTTGGTGPAPRDITPEATRAVIEREAPGLAEVLRWRGYHQTPLAVISRGIAGIRGGTLIINLPGNPKAVREGIETLTPILPHAIKMLKGLDTEHSPETRQA